MHYDKLVGIPTQIAVQSDVRGRGRVRSVCASVSRQIGESVRPSELMRQGERVCAHAAAPEREQGQTPRSGRPAGSRRRGTRGTYLQTVPAPSAETAGTSHGRASTHAQNPIEEPDVMQVWLLRNPGAGRQGRTRWDELAVSQRGVPGLYKSRHVSAPTDPA
jgi:hypothetical protein